MEKLYNKFLFWQDLCIMHIVMSITINTVKRLFAVSGNLCAFPGCKQPIIDDQNDGALIGEICHIKGKKSGSARHDMDYKRADHYENLILLCRNHHAVVDQNAQEHDVARLVEMKNRHEAQNKGGRLVIKPENIRKIIADNELFKIRISRALADNHGPEDLRIGIVPNIGWKSLFSEIDADLGRIIDLFSTWENSDESLEDDLKKVLSAYGLDLRKYKTLPYYKNPFCNRNWEMRVLGVQNITVDCRAHIIQLKIMFLTEYLKTHDSRQAKQALNLLKNKLTKIAKETIYYD